MGKRGGSRTNWWGDPIRAGDGIPQWPKEDIDEMLMELLGCSKREAEQMRKHWMQTGVSPRVGLLWVAALADDDT